MHEPGTAPAPCIPRLKAIVLSDTIAIDPLSRKLSVLGLFENVTAPKGTATAINAAVVVVLSDVTGPVDVTIDTVGYPGNSPLGERLRIGLVQIVPPELGHTSVIYIQGRLVLPATDNGIVDVLVYGNSQYLGHRSVHMLPPATPPPAATEQ